MRSGYVTYKQWRRKDSPKRVLVIRLQATGDMVLSLPFMESLREQLPAGARLDFLVREEVEDIPKQLVLFDHIYSIKGGRSSKKQLLWLLWMIPGLLSNRYDAVLDLQNNKISKIARKLLMPACWVEFDRQSSNHATERYRLTIEASGFASPEMRFNYVFKDPGIGRDKLIAAGWNQEDDLVLLNPAGAFITRNWDLDNYAEFCRLYKNEINAQAKFLILGLPHLISKAIYLKNKLGDDLINLVGLTTPSEAFGICKHLTFALSEDSGLMHMAYLSKIPTVCLLGSTRKDWTDPCLPHTFSFHSDDLACGNCMQATCKINSLLCMVRVTPSMVITVAKNLLGK